MKKLSPLVFLTPISCLSWLSALAPPLHGNQRPRGAYVDAKRFPLGCQATGTLAVAERGQPPDVVLLGARLRGFFGLNCNFLFGPVLLCAKASDTLSFRFC